MATLSDTGADKSLERSSTRVQGFQDAEMDFQLIRQLGAAAYGGASVGECLATARDIVDASPASWSQAFERLGKRQLADADARSRKGHLISAREQYLRACNSFRAAEYHAPQQEPRHRELGLASRAAFIAAMALEDHSCEEVWVPLGELKLPAYFMRPAGLTGPAKTLIIVSGFDGTTEESYLQGGKAALQRGYNVMCVAGPGQMDTLRFYPDRGMIPDFERVVTAALDGLLQRPEVNPEQVAVLGLSFGGYFASRAAAHDSRIKAVIANSPIVDLHAYMTSFNGFDGADLPDSDDFDLETLAGLPPDMISEQQKEMAASLIRRFGQRTFKETFIFLKSFRVGEALANITCPALALVGSGEGANPLAQFETFCAGVGGPVSSYVFGEDFGADSHCQVGNLSFGAAVTLDWLDEVFV